MSERQALHKMASVARSCLLKDVWKGHADGNNDRTRRLGESRALYLIARSVLGGREMLICSRHGCGWSGRVIDVSLRSLSGQSSVCMLMTRRTACCTQGMYTFFKDKIRIHHILRTRSRPLLKFPSFFFPDMGLIMPDVLLLSTCCLPACCSACLSVSVFWKASLCVFVNQSVGITDSLPRHTEAVEFASELWRLPESRALLSDTFRHTLCRSAQHENAPWHHPSNLHQPHPWLHAAAQTACQGEQSKHSRLAGYGSWPRHGGNER